MPFETGGLSEKLGNRYEGRWIAKQLLNLLEEKIQSVIVESIGDDEEGVDLWISKNGKRIAQQCKGRNASLEYWRISDFNKRGITNHIMRQLDRDKNYEFEFVSGIGFSIFYDICDYARRSNNNAKAFYEIKIKGQSEKVLNCFKSFCNHLNIDYENHEELKIAFSYLKRSYVTIFQNDLKSCFLKIFL